MLASEATPRTRGASDDQVALAAPMADYWVNLAVNGGSAPNWPNYGVGGANHHCTSWQSLFSAS